MWGMEEGLYQGNHSLPGPPSRLFLGFTGKMYQWGSIVNEETLVFTPLTHQASPLFQGSNPYSDLILTQIKVCETELHRAQC